MVSISIRQTQTFQEVLLSHPLLLARLSTFVLCHHSKCFLLFQHIIECREYDSPGIRIIYQTSQCLPWLPPCFKHWNNTTIKIPGGCTIGLQLQEWKEQTADHLIADNLNNQGRFVEIRGSWGMGRRACLDSMISRQVHIDQQCKKNTTTMKKMTTMKLRIASSILTLTNLETQNLAYMNVHLHQWPKEWSMPNSELK